MVATIFRTLIFLLFPAIVLGQSLNVSVSSPTSNNNPSTFLLEEGEISVNSNALRFLRSGKTITGFEDFGISPDRSIVSLLMRTTEGGEIILFNSRGDTLETYSTNSLAQDDPSLAVYPFNSGDVLLRDNITNFTFYNTFGDVATSMSSSSQSKEGEAISEVSMSSDGKTVVIYNPKIKRQGQLGSKAEVKVSRGNFENIFFSNDRYLKDLTVSDDGNIVVAVTAKSGTDDQVLIMDKYGNELNTITAEENLKGAVLSSDNEHITLYSSGRVMVYSMMDGESLGSTSLRSSVFLADYFPEDDMILVLTGNYSTQTGTLNNPEFEAIDVAQRQIASGEFSGAIGFTTALNPRLIRVSADQYKLSGASKEVVIEVNF